MKAYSEDLRHKVVQAVEQRGMSKSHTARLFGISLSSVKRYVRLANRGESITPRKGGGRPPKADEATGSFLKNIYAQGQPLPSQTGATSWRASLARLLGNLS
jgi:transposase